MSNKAISLARKVSGMSQGARAQLVLLADHADKDYRCWPSQELIANDLGVSVYTVQRRNRELEWAGLITRRRRGSRKRRGRATDIYTLHLDINAGAKTPHGCGVNAGLTPQSCGLNPGINTAIARPIEESEPSISKIEPSIPPGSTRSGERDSPSSAQKGSVWPTRTRDGTVARDYIAAHGYRTKAGMTIEYIDLLRQLSRDGLFVPHLIGLIDEGFLAAVDQLGNPTPPDAYEYECVAITELGLRVEVWPEAEEELWPPEEAYAENCEEGLWPSTDDDEAESGYATSSPAFPEWDSINEVFERCAKANGVMHFGGVIAAGDNIGEQVNRESLFKAIGRGLLARCRADATLDPKGTYLVRTSADAIDQRDAA